MSVPMATSRPVAKGQRGPAPGGVTLGQEHNAQTRRVAAAVLEVLAGARTPGEAAVALGVSVPRYYQIESRALRGLLEACAPLPRGPGKDTAKEIARAKVCGGTLVSPALADGRLFVRDDKEVICLRLAK